MKMLRKSLLLCSLVLVGLMTGTSDAGMVSFDIGGKRYTDTGPLNIPDNAIEIIIKDTVANTVEMSVKFVSGGANGVGSKVGQLVFNLSGITINSIDPIDPSGTGSYLKDFTQSNNGEKLTESLDKFDLTMNISHGNNKLEVGDNWFYTVVGPGLSSLSFLETTEQGRYAAAHIQAFDGDASGKYGDFVPAVPEPTSLSLWAIGLVGTSFGASRRRRSR